MTVGHSDQPVIARSWGLYRVVARGATAISFSAGLIVIDSVPGRGRVDLAINEIEGILEERSWLWTRLTVRGPAGTEYTIPALPKAQAADLVASLHDEATRLAEQFAVEMEGRLAQLAEVLSGKRYLGTAEGELIRDRIEQLLAQTPTGYLRSRLPHEAIAVRAQLREIAAVEGFERARQEANRRCLEAVVPDLVSRLLRNKAARLARQVAGDLLDLDERVSAILAADRYVRYGEGQQLLRQVEAAIALARPQIIGDYLPSEAAEAKDHLRTVAIDDDFERARVEANERFVATAIPSVVGIMEASFGVTLTDEQAAAIATDDDTTLVLAGAGTSKTSVIVGKVAHLVHNQHVSPQEILVLAYNNKAAAEIRSRLGNDLVDVEVRTFHSFGVRVISSVSSAPNLSKMAGDQRRRDRAFDQILDDLFTDARDADGIPDFVAHHSQPYRSPFEFDTPSDYYQYVREIEMRTLNDEKVKSYAELSIANFLALNGISYLYEQPFQAHTADTRYRQYQPDFYLPDYEIYIEHFALDVNGLAPANWLRYDEGVRWKRGLHEKHGTQLIETYSWQCDDNSLLPNLERRLRDHGVWFEPTPIGMFLDRLKGIIASWLARLLSTFLNLVKTAGLTMDDLRNRAAGLPQPRRAAAFLDLFEQVWTRYERLLTGEDAIDFEDMINHATDAIHKSQWLSPFRYVLVDEFQDISAGRLALLGALRRSGVAYFLAGDDWQSIYRFAGSDVTLLNSCGNRLGFVQRRDLTQTFRYGESIAKPSREFIQRNPEQTHRALRSGNVDPGEGVTIVAANEPERGVLAAVSDIDELVVSKDDMQIMVLGRYQNSRRHVRQLLAKSNVEFSTIHSAKGRETDYVIVLDLGDGYQGFPSRREDDPLLNLVLNEPSAFPHAEERRLFYVAMTRARRGVYLVADANHPSAFVRELRHDQPTLRQIGEFLTDDAPPCPLCGGRLVISQTGKTRRCTNHPYCAYQAPRCGDCGNGYLIVGDGQAKCSNSTCANAAPACPRCKIGVLQQRQSRRGPFWGCSEYFAEPPCRYTHDV